MATLALVTDYWDSESSRLGETILRRLYTGNILVENKLLVYNPPSGRFALSWDKLTEEVFQVKESEIKNNSNYIIYKLSDFINKYPQVLMPRKYEIARKDVGPRYLPINIISWDENNNCPCFGYDGHDTYPLSMLDFLIVEKTDDICLHEEMTTSIRKYVGNIVIEYPTRNSVEIVEYSDGSILISPKKITYPKTLEECFSIVLNYEKQELIRTNFSGTYKNSLEGLYELLIARKAYWEIYRKLNNISEDVILGRDKYLCSLELNTSPLRNILIFPEEECMREFYKNFKDPIDKVRDLFTYLEDNL